MKKHLATWLTAASLWLGCAVGMASAAVEANRASPEDLMAIRGIGPATSQRIIEARQERPFSNWADFIQRTRGVGPVRAARMSEQGLTVNGQPFDAATSATTPTASPATAPPAPAGTVQTPLWQPVTPLPLLIPQR